MARKFSTAQLQETFWIALPVIAISAGAFWFAFQFVEPAPPRTISIATGGASGAYYAYGEHYAKLLKKSGIKLEVKETSGSLENVQILKRSENRNSLALLQGGIADQKSAPDLVSLGRVFLEPLWIFHRESLELARLRDLEGLKVAIGSEKSGTRHLAIELLKKNNMTLNDIAANADGGIKAVRALEEGKVDAIILVISPKSALIPRLLRNSDIALMSFARADAYARLFPYLNKVVLPQGVVDMAKNIPAEDINLLAASAALVARRDFHPALAGLVAQAAKETHNNGGLFEKMGEFPTNTDAEFPMSKDAASVYENGPPFLQRYMPFWLASLITRMVVMLVPIATVFIPLVKIIPFVYKWIIRQRLLYWYQTLKSVEVEMAGDPEGTKANAQMLEVDRIEEAANNIRIPIGFADQHYELRSAIDLVRQRLEGRIAKRRLQVKGPDFIPA